MNKYIDTSSKSIVNYTHGETFFSFFRPLVRAVFYMEHLIVNIVSQETLTQLNKEYGLHLCRESVTRLRPTPTDKAFDKIKRFMESNRGVNYECIKD